MQTGNEATQVSGWCFSALNALSVSVLLAPSIRVSVQFLIVLYVLILGTAAECESRRQRKSKLRKCHHRICKSGTVRRGQGSVFQGNLSLFFPAFSEFGSDKLRLTFPAQHCELFFSNEVRSLLFFLFMDRANKTLFEFLAAKASFCAIARH